MTSLKVGDIVKSDSKFDYVVSQVGPKLLFKVQYENLEENFSELIIADNVQPIGQGNMISKKAQQFFSEGDKVEAKLFNEWKPATILGSQFGEFEITCYKKGTKKAYFSEWIIRDTTESINDAKKESSKSAKTVNVERQLTSFADVIATESFAQMIQRVNEISITEKWDQTLSVIRKTYIKPTWDGTKIDNEFHVFLLACTFDRNFTKEIKAHLENENLSVTTDEENLHKSRVLLLIYCDNATYDEKLVRLLTRGSELANAGELCIITVVHPSCSLYRQNMVPDNMAYSLASSTWYSLIGIDSPNISFQEMVSQIKSYTCELSLDINDNTSMAGLWYCKYVVSGDFCSNFYDSKTIALYLNHESGKVYGRTTSGILLDGTLRKDRIFEISGAYCGPWKQMNEGWDVEYYKVLIYIKGVLDYKGDRFQGQIVEISQIDDKLYECVGTISAQLQNQGVSGFYEYSDSLGALRGEKQCMAIIHQRGGDILADIEGNHGTTFPGVIDTSSKRFWVYVRSGVSTCTTFEGMFNFDTDSGNRLNIQGSYFRCVNGVTTIPKTKFTGIAINPVGMIKAKKLNLTRLVDVVNQAQRRTLESSISNTAAFTPPNDDDFPTLVLGDEEDIEIITKLQRNLIKSGIAPITSSYEDLHRARTVCLVLTTRVRDNEDLVSKIRYVSSKDVPFFVICADSRRDIFSDENWNDLDMKQSLMSCLARLMQTGEMTLDPSSLMFTTLVKEIKSRYMPPIYFLSGMWSIRTFDTVKLLNDYDEAESDARKGKGKTLTVPRLVYILCDGATGSIVGINDFVSNKPFEGGVDPEKATFNFDNKDSKYELVIEQNGQSMQGTYTNRIHGYKLDITMTLELDDISGVYKTAQQNLVIAIVKTGHHTIDVHYGNYVLPGTFTDNLFSVSIPRYLRRKPMTCTICGVLQRSVSGATLICFEYASISNMKALQYSFDLMQTKFQKLDDKDKINVKCEPSVKNMMDRYIDAYNSINYDEYRDLHSDFEIENEEAFTMYCKRSQDLLGKIQNYIFVGKRKMNEESLSHLSITRYEFDLIYDLKTRREFFIVDEESKLKGNLSLEEEAQQFHSSIYDVMITYRSMDGQWADFLQSYLEQNGILCWRDQRMEIGSNWSADITSAIRLAKCELVLLSEEYLRSEMCTKEINLAYDSGKIIVPIVLPYTDANKPKPLVKSTYKPAFPPHHISHETSQSTWIDFRPSSCETDPENLNEFIQCYDIPLSILLTRLRLAKVGSHICDINGEWLVTIKDTNNRSIKKKIVLQHHGRIPVGLLQEPSGRPVARLSSQSLVHGTRLYLYFSHPISKEVVLGIKAMMSGDSKSFTGILIDADNRSTVSGTKIETDARPVERGPLIYDPNAEGPIPNYSYLREKYPQLKETEIKQIFEKFCSVDTSNDYSLSADEIVSCLKQMGKPLPKRLVLEHIRKYDIEQSGHLNFDEFLMFYSKSQQQGKESSSAVCSIQ